MAVNIRRYPWYIFFRDCYFWGPAFFLYFSSVLPLSQVLWLEAVYYFSTAILEVPSGYLSDRFGRKITLLISSACLALAYLLFFLGGGFTGFALAQVFMAAGFAAASGTDTAFHYESLAGAGQPERYTVLEGRSLKFSLRAGALGALAGGLIASLSLSWIYAASCAAALASLWIVSGFREPPESASSDSGKTAAAPMGRQVIWLMTKAFSPRFRFFTLYTLSMTLLLHLPYEFYQPYLARVMDGFGETARTTPMLTGTHLALTLLTGSLFTRFAGRIHLRCRVRSALLGAALFQVLLVGGMALVVHPLVVVMLVFRTASRAVSVPLVNGELSPLLHRSERSTYLSLQSLLGRLAYGLVLVLLPLGTLAFDDGLRAALVSAFLLGLLLWLVLRAIRFPRDPGHACCGSHGGNSPGGHHTHLH